MKSGMPLGPHLGDEFASDEPFADKQLKNIGFKQLSEHIFLKKRNRHKGTIGTKNSGGNQGMDVRIPVEKIPRCSNREDAGRQEFFGNRNFQVLANRLPCAAAQFCQ